MAAGLCRHCRSARITRPRNLCWVCFYTPKIRRQYPAETTNARLPDRWRRLPHHATLAPPGSAEKIAVLALRARRGEELWHPDDVTLDPRVSNWAFEDIPVY